MYFDIAIIINNCNLNVNTNIILLNFNLLLHFFGHSGIMLAERFGMNPEKAG